MILIQIMLLKHSKLVLAVLSDFFSCSWTSTALTIVSVVETYNNKSAPGVGEANVFGCSRYFFIFSNACCYEGLQTKSLLDPLSA
jgi:hypothetical protein